MLAQPIDRTGQVDVVRVGHLGERGSRAADGRAVSDRQRARSRCGQPGRRCRVAEDGLYRAGNVDLRSDVQVAIDLRLGRYCPAGVLPAVLRTASGSIG